VAYQLKIEQKPGYLHFTVAGRNSPDTVASYMQEVMQEVAARHCPRVLIEENLEGPRLGTMEVFSMVTAGAKRHHGELEALAFVDLNAEGGLMRFAEDVAVNRGIPVRVFRNLEAAEKWLLARSGSAGASPDTQPQKSPQ
jgi:hypothetical protein